MLTGITGESLIRRDRFVVVVSAGGLLILSWIVLSRHALSTSSHHAVLMPHALPAPGGRFALAFLMWMVMMVAMMLPPVMPWILLFASASRTRSASAPPFVRTGLFVGGYLTTWAVYCLAAAAVQLVLQQRGLLGADDQKTIPLVGAGLLISAGLYQLTPLKSACLRHCRSPISFFLSRWRNGPAGAFQMGLRHGLYCVACCWALMALSFALGVMNLLWMAAVTLMLCVEKIAPGGRLLSRVFGLLLTTWGVYLLVS